MTTRVLAERHLVAYAAVVVGFLGSLAVGHVAQEGQASAAPAPSTQLIEVESTKLELGRTHGAVSSGGED